MDLMGGASRDPAAAQKSIDTLKGLASGLANEGPRIMKELDSAGEAARRGDWGLVAHHVAGSAPLFGAAVQNAAQEWDRGDKSAAAGHTAALFAPFLASKVPPVAGRAANAVAESAPAVGLKAGVKAAAPDLATGAGMIAGGELLAQVPGMSYPAHIAMAYPAAKMIKSGLAKGAAGWKQAIAERATAKAAAANESRLAAEAQTIPPEVMEELTRESGPPQEAMAAPQGQPIPTPAPRWEDAAALDRLKQAQTQAGSPVSAPAEPVPPQIGTQPAAAPPEAATVTPAPRSIAQNEAAMMQKAAPPLDPQQSQFHANGEPKSAAFRGMEKTRGNTTAKATRWADALEGEGISAEDVRNIEGGRISDTQLAGGEMAPRWDNLKDYLIEKGVLEPGETVPRSSMPEIIAELSKRAKGKAATEPAIKPAEVSLQPKSPTQMNRAELSKQAGLPADATKEQIMQALADAMAAAGGK